MFYFVKATTILSLWYNYFSIHVLLSTRIRACKFERDENGIIYQFVIYIKQQNMSVCMCVSVGLRLKSSELWLLQIITFLLSGIQVWYSLTIFAQVVMINHPMLSSATNLEFYYKERTLLSDVLLKEVRNKLNVTSK